MFSIGLVCEFLSAEVVSLAKGELFADVQCTKTSLSLLFTHRSSAMIQRTHGIGRSQDKFTNALRT